MTKMRVLDNESFGAEFERCCNEYSSLDIATAWCGDPSRTLPYAYLAPEKNELKISLTMGVYFNQSHPESIRYFIDSGIDIKIFKNELALFHPKIYLFKNNNKAALFIGSSNFTYCGFYNNIELNLLTEGVIAGDFKVEINKIEKLLSHWHSNKCSFLPEEKWLAKYINAYKKQRSTEKNNNITTPSDHEEAISHSNWLANSNWSIYFKKVIAGLKEKNVMNLVIQKY